MGKCMTELVDQLAVSGNLAGEAFGELLRYRNVETTEYLFEQARATRRQVKKDVLQIWGRVPMSNYCKNNCKMCGMRRENQFVKRYRMDTQGIIECCQYFAGNGVQTFLLESGEDVFFTEAYMWEILTELKRRFPKGKIILSLGEKNRDFYQKMKRIGAYGALLHHGTANSMHFKKIFPANMSPLLKKQGLWQLKELGYHAGSGFLVGMPYQTIEHVLEDMWLLKEFEASIVEVGAYIPTPRTPLENQRSGNGEMTLYILAALRLMLPDAMIVASPTLDCVLKDGRMRCFDAGADVLLIDLPDEELLNRYGAYQRKSGRLFLPGDNMEKLTGQLKERGLFQ